jgi:GrpB-like predicted nucleotidyltransferase (UPF0157 family)
MFAAEQQRLINALDDRRFCVHHIGSTAVAGLSAKPIIDIVIECASLLAMDEKTPEMESLGYIAKGENGIENRRFFLKGGVQRSHHVHAFISGSPEVTRHLAFRDYLRAHPEKVTEYSAIKQAALAQADNDAIKYMAFKNDFIKTTEAAALK